MKAIIFACNKAAFSGILIFQGVIKIIPAYGAARRSCEAA